MHIALGAALFSAGRLREAVTAYERALALDSADVEAASDLGLILAESGRLGEALFWHERALQNQPNHYWALVGRARVQLVLGRYDEARSDLERALAEQPSSAVTAPLLIQIAILEGDRDGSVRLASKYARELSKPTVLTAAAAAFQVSGQDSKARDLLLRATRDESKGGNQFAYLRLAAVEWQRGDLDSFGRIAALLEAWSQDEEATGSERWQSPYWMAGLAAIQGETEAAMSYLRTAREKGYLNAAWIAVDPVFANLWDEPSFELLARSMRLRAQESLEAATGATLSSAS